MSNVGLEVTLNKAGGRVVQTDVGDRYVTEEMRAQGYNLGGEPTGHLCFLDHHVTMDGIITALQILDIVIKKQKPLAELAEDVRLVPRVSLDVRVSCKEDILCSQEIKQEIRKVREELGQVGKVVVRPSLWEPVTRVVIDGEDEDRIRKMAQGLAQTIANILGQS